MSVFSNGGYVPPGMEFDEFIEYQEAYRNYLDEQEFFKFLEEEYPEEVGSSEPIIKVTGELLDSIRSTADYVLGDIKNNLAGRTKDQKLESISELQEQNHKRLLFEFIKQNGVVSEYEFIFEGEPTSFLDEERQAQTFKYVNQILDAKSFDPNDKELMKALNFYDSVLKKDGWAKDHLQDFENWTNDRTGNQHAVYAKILDAKFKVLEESIVQEPEKKLQRQRSSVSR